MGEELKWLDDIGVVELDDVCLLCFEFVVMGF